jgi:hypothetical protein
MKETRDMPSLYKELSQNSFFVDVDFLQKEAEQVRDIIIKRDQEIISLRECFDKGTRSVKIIEEMSNIEKEGIVLQYSILEQYASLSASISPHMLVRFEELFNSLTKIYNTHLSKVSWDIQTNIEPLARQLMLQKSSENPIVAMLGEQYSNLMAEIDKLLYEVQHKDECFRYEVDIWGEAINDPEQDWKEAREKLKVICESTRDLLFTGKMSPKAYEQIAKQFETNTSHRNKWGLAISTAMLALSAAAIAVMFTCTSLALVVPSALLYALGTPIWAIIGTLYFAAAVLEERNEYQLDKNMKSIARTVAKHGIFQSQPGSLQAQTQINASPFFRAIGVAIMSLAVAVLAFEALGLLFPIIPVWLAVGSAIGGGLAFAFGFFYSNHRRDNFSKEMHDGLSKSMSDISVAASEINLKPL